MTKIFLSKPAKFLYGILLIPLCYSVLLSLLYVLHSIKYSHNTVIIFFLGMMCYFLIHVLFYRPIKLYVYGHELVHALSAFLFGGKVKNMDIRKSSGSVTVSKINSFVILSPYFVPIYSLILIILWNILTYIFKLQVKQEIFIFLLGFTLMFHVMLTLYAVYVGQKDFEISGWLFSLVIVFIMNILVLIVLFLTFLPHDTNFKRTFYYFCNQTVNVYKIILTFLAEKVENLVKNIRQR